MDSSLLDAVTEAVKAHADAEKRLRESALEVLNAFEKRREEFERLKERVNDDIERKARYTKHRLSL